VALNGPALERPERARIERGACSGG
jgi:hypothetical protein